MRHKGAKIIFSIFLLIFLIGVLAGAGIASHNRFEVGSILLKSVIKAGSSLDSQIRVINLQDSTTNFEIKVLGLEEGVSTKEKSFSVPPRESKNVELVFSALNISEGIYVGNIEISSGEEKKFVPVVLEVESEDVLFDGSIGLYPTGKIFAGDKINAEIKIFDLSRIGMSNIELNYFIKDFSGDMILSETENLVVENQISVTKSMMLPQDVEKKDYVFGVLIKYKNSVGTASSVFRIEEKEKILFSDKNLIYFIILFVFVLLIFLIFIFYLICSRDKLLEELKKQYRIELKKQAKYLREKEKERARIFKTKEEKKIIRKIFRKVAKKRKREIVKIHRERVKKLKSLKKEKKKDEMQRQIEKWKKQGYDTMLLEKKIKVPSVKEIKKQIREWKKKGYKTEILEKE